MPNRKTKFRIACMPYLKGMWSFGFGLSHEDRETYIWFNLFKWNIEIGMMRA